MKEVMQPHEFEPWVSISDLCGFVTAPNYVCGKPRKDHPVMQPNQQQIKESPRCPKCGFVMCEQFDSQRINDRAELATPNGTYICYGCGITGEAETTPCLSTDRISKDSSLNFSDAVAIARGCFDYGGGYRDDDAKLKIFHHGIQTVVNALESAERNGLRDLQIQVLHAVGNGAYSAQPSITPQVAAKDCICHQGSVCTLLGCDLYHHEGCRVHLAFHAPVTPPTVKRFRIRWDGDKYTVNIANYDGGEVVKASDYDSLRTELEAAQKVLKVCRSAITLTPESVLGHDAEQGYPYKDELLSNIDKVLEGVEADEK